MTDRPFAHLEAIFVATSGEERVLLLLNILQREQTLAFPIEIVRKISSR